MQRIAFLAGAAVLFAGLAPGAAPAPRKSPVASPPPPAAPAPGPEIGKLGDFVGTWKMEGEMQKSPMGPGGKTSATTTCAWFDGGFFLVCHVEGTTPAGKTKALDIFAWDGDKKRYTFTSINSLGMMTVATGSVKENTWTYTNDQKMGKDTMKSRFVLVHASPDRNTMSWSISPEGNTWSELFRGEETRVKEARKAAKPAKH